MQVFKYYFFLFASENHPKVNNTLNKIKGEVNWLPKRFWMNNDSITPDQYSIEYARMASRLGKMVEVRTGCQTQDLPIFVRMLDKDSKWVCNFLNSVKYKEKKSENLSWLQKGL